MSLSHATGTLGTSAPPFDLPGTDGRRHTLASVRGANGTVVMFICNHCPYVQGGHRQDRARHATSLPRMASAASPS